MKLPGALQEVSVAEFTASPNGVRILGESAVLQGVVAQYCAAESRPEDVLRSGNQYVGCGNHSEVWQINGIAVKASSHSTGREVRKLGNGNNGTPEDLTDQFEFMSVLGHYANQRSKGRLIVPEQYFALRTPKGDYLSAQEYMAGWVSLPIWAASQEYDRPQERALYRAIQGRILENVGGAGLRLGLFDLGLASWRRLHAENVLVRADATSVETDAQLCIIDQPSHGISGKLGVLATSFSGKRAAAA